MTELRNYNIDEIRRMDAENHLHPFTDYAEMAKDGGARIITRAEGCYLWDADGNQILDGMAGLWCVNVGYGRKELAETAYRQMLELPYYNTFFKTSTPPVAELSAKICSHLGPNFNRVFFSNSGSEANDTMFRLVRHYWNLMERPTKKTIISRVNAYHGSTVAGASLGGMKPMHEQADLPIPGVEHVMQPYWFKEAKAGESKEDFGIRAARAVEDKILELGADNVGAFIGEPIQGAGGVIVPPTTYWPEINRICRKYDILLVADEVICGFGRTGEWFGHQALGIEPDLIPMAKGLSSGYLPVSALAISDRIANVLIEKGGEFYHGYTYSGHPAACAVALNNIEIIEREGLVEKVKNETGPYLAKALGRLADLPLVGEVRSFGLLGAVDLVKNKETGERFDPAGKVGIMCRDYCMEHGVVARPCGDIMVMSPPLIIETSQIDDLVNTIGSAIEDAARKIG
ncbi:MAG: aspartate aminotransferase family protein [Alphaproteobacteria bacterium]